MTATTHPRGIPVITLLLDVHAFVCLVGGIHAAAIEVVGVLRAGFQAEFAGAGVDRPDDGSAALFIYDYDFEGFRNRSVDASARGIEHLRLRFTVVIRFTVVAIAVVILVIFESVVNKVAAHRHDERLVASPAELADFNTVILSLGGKAVRFSNQLRGIQPLTLFIPTMITVAEQKTLAFLCSDYYI